MAANFAPLFKTLRACLNNHRGSLAVRSDTTTAFSLEAPTGPATVKAWKGKVKSPAIPVAWVEIQKNYVSYHLMGVYGYPKLLETISPKLKARMQGKSCFNFTAIDEPLFQELATLTGASIAVMRKAGFILDPLAPC